MVLIEQTQAITATRSTAVDVTMRSQSCLLFYINLILIMPSDKATSLPVIFSV